MQTHTRCSWLFSVCSFCTGLLLPFAAQAQGAAVAPPANDSPMFGTFALFVIVSALLTRFWIGIMDESLREEETTGKTKAVKRPHSLRVILNAFLGTACLFFLSQHTMGSFAPFNGPHGSLLAASIFILLGIAWVLGRLRWPIRSQQYLFAVFIGTVITCALIGFKTALFSGRGDNPFLMALGFVCVFLAWRFLFGPWKPPVKAAVLGTFVFWVGVHLIFRQDPSQRLAYLISIGIALIPAVVWCGLFLEYHRQRKSMVVLMFLSGMLSTAPILFYDAMVRRGIELQFFLFRIVPESFTRSSSAFVSGNIVSGSVVHATVMTTLVSFLIVGLIEEWSKYWVLRKSGEAVFKSIDDVMQLAIIVAIGFAFAENVLNPTYFLAFVREYLLGSDSPDWSSFLGNIMGRSVLTNMVHIVSTGVLGYFYGYALFARPYLEDVRARGGTLFLASLLHRFLRLPEKAVFRRQALCIGFVIAIVLHGLFNFLVTLPDILPGNPRTVGDVFGAPLGSPLHYIAILIIPSLFYVVGGFWLLSMLFYKKESMKERGHLVRVDTFVTDKTAAA